MLQTVVSSWNTVWPLDGAAAMNHYVFLKTCPSVFRSTHCVLVVPSCLALVSQRLHSIDHMAKKVVVVFSSSPKTEGSDDSIKHTSAGVNPEQGSVPNWLV